MRTRNLFIVGAIILMVGILFGVASYEIYETYQGNKGKYTKLDAKVVEVNKKKNKMVIEYYVKGDEYKKEINTYDKDSYVGESITILYNPNKPEEIMNTNLKLFCKVFAILCVILFITGVLICMFAVDKKIKNKKTA